MRIGILTFHNSDNYGAVLQTTGLYTKVKELGAEVEVIDYVCPNKVKMYSLLDIGSHNSIKSNIRSCIKFPFKYAKKRKFSHVSSKLYKLSNKKYLSNEELQKDATIWDATICGSDQIWNHDNTKFDTTYFLDFIKEKNKKISYAASFGISEINDKYKKEYSQLLNDIGMISVREHRGKEIVEELTHREAEVVVDPTLLLTKEEWYKFSVPMKQSEKYVLLYTLYNSKEICELAEQIAQKNGVKVVKIAGDTLDYISKYKIVMPTPEQYVSLINNAECVVTDSFHGTIFSVNLNTPFYCFLKKINKNNSRMTNILSSLDLSDRIIYDKVEDVNIKNIDFDKVNQILDEERLKSLRFLKQAIQNTKLSY